MKLIEKAASKTEKEGKNNKQLLCTFGELPRMGAIGEEASGRGCPSENTLGQARVTLSCAACSPAFPALERSGLEPG